MLSYWSSYAQVTRVVDSWCGGIQCCSFAQFWSMVAHMGLSTFFRNGNPRPEIFWPIMRLHDFYPRFRFFQTNLSLSLSLCIYIVWIDSLPFIIRLNQLSRRFSTPQNSHTCYQWNLPAWSMPNPMGVPQASMKPTPPKTPPQLGRADSSVGMVL